MNITFFRNIWLSYVLKTTYTALFSDIRSYKSKKKWQLLQQNSVAVEGSL